MVVPFVAMIHSLDSVRLAEAIQKAAAAAGRTIDVLLEIHVADEESKSGWEWAELQEYVRSGAFARLPNLRVRGVMGVATNTGDEQVIRRDFAALQRYKSELSPYSGRSSIPFRSECPRLPDRSRIRSDAGAYRFADFGARDYSK